MPEEKNFSEKQLVVFDIAKEEFGVDINEVREIIRMENITKIPNTADYIKGVINLRGGIIVVIDLAKKLGLPVRETDKNTRIIVIETKNNTIGMIVDSATEVLRLNNKDIKPAPTVITKKIQSDYLEGVGVIGERLLILLDLAKVLESKEIANIQSIQESGQTKQAMSKSKEEKAKADLPNALKEAEKPQPQDAKKEKEPPQKPQKKSNTKQ